MTMLGASHGTGDWWINVPKRPLEVTSNNKTLFKSQTTKTTVFQHLGRVFLILGVFFVNTIGWLRVCIL